ncbi:MAG: ParA family protein [Leptolyngbyaceae cyanobacterium SL_7_1]|nr:ParA family protein [Leptolyngbyaceae cyanobacterium SL_7_1]
MIITVTSLKGGVGKTTTAIHLAAYLQNQANTLLIDADPNRSASGWANRGKLPFEVVDERQTPRSDRPYDHVVIDTQARPLRDELVVLAESCDLLIIPTTPDVMALEALVLMLENLKSVAVNHYRVLLTQLPTQSNRSLEQVKTILTTTKVPLFKTGIRRFTVFREAADRGVLVLDVKDAKAIEAWQDYQRVGQELLEGVGL